MIRETVQARFWRRVERGDPDACWLWRGGTTAGRQGYGRFYDGCRKVYPHRFSYELHYGSIPPGYVVDHHCRVPLCVNPRHLEAVSLSENTLRVKRPGRRGALPRAVAGPTAASFQPELEEWT